MLHMARIKTECEFVDGSSVLQLNTHLLRGFILKGLTAPLERQHVPVHTEPHSSHL